MEPMNWDQNALLRKGIPFEADEATKPIPNMKSILEDPRQLTCHESKVWIPME
jgi:hypothetical protein